MKQVGEAEWAVMSERERQGKLMKLKLQERKLRQEGRYDEAAALLGQGIRDQQGEAPGWGWTETGKLGRDIIHIVNLWELASDKPHRSKLHWFPLFLPAVQVCFKMPMPTDSRQGNLQEML